MIPNETLMAYLDGELDPNASARVESALRADPELAARAAQYRSLRTRLESAYRPELDEPVPERLLAVLRAPVRASVTDLDAARAARNAARAGRYSRATRLTSIAAGVLLAVGAGLFLWRNSQVMIRTANGTLVASGALARGLSDQLAGDSPPSSRVTIGLSFVAKSGDYCRTFSIARETQGAGLACRRNGEWRISVLSPQSPGVGEELGYRTASSSLPPAVLAAVQAQISGDPLDRAGEIAARGRGWRVNP
jgi:hypothetical protein